MTSDDVRRYILRGFFASVAGALAANTHPFEGHLEYGLSISTLEASGPIHAGGDEPRKLDPPKATPPYRRLEIKSVGDVNVVAFVDRKLRKDQDVHELGQELDRFIAGKRAPDILLDLRAVEFLSDSAMGKLLIFQKRVKAQAGEVKLCGLHSDIAELFKVIRLDQVFEIHRCQADGLKAF